MQRKQLNRFIPVLLFAGLFMTAAPVSSTFAGKDAATATMAEKVGENVLKGKITGKSQKAKSITIEVGKGEAAKALMVKYDDATKGLEFAEPGEAAIIKYEVRGTDKIAVEIKQKLAQLPEGVSEMKPDELAALMGNASGESYFLVDSRPAGPYNEAHVPGAVNIPVALLQKEGKDLLPANKDIQLIFYCGGVT